MENTTKRTQWVRLGQSGLKVSQVVIGFMSYGSKEWAQWVEDDEDKVFAILKRAYDLGLRTYDTADVYSNGRSEELLCKFLKRYAIPRERVVIMTKVYFPVDESLDLKHGGMGDDVDAMDLELVQGLSRKHIMDAVEQSVRRLGTYIDLYQIHRYDHSTPPEETMRALNDCVASGHVRYLGASSMRATEFAELQFIAERNGWHKFVSMQDYYNLLYREEEREMHHFCKRTGVGLLAWSPNARGVLTRPFDGASDRALSDPTMRALGLNVLSAADKLVIERVGLLAKELGVSMAQVTSAWVVHKGAVPLIGLNSIARVEEAVEASLLSLTASQVEYLDQQYAPKAVVGHK